MRLTVIVIFIFILTTLGFARELKIGVVDFQQVFANYSETKKVNDKLLKAVSYTHLTLPTN